MSLKLDSIENEKEVLKTIPQSYFDFGFINIFKFFRNGLMFFVDLKKKHNSSVYRVKMEENWIMTCDYVSSKYVFDENYVFKELAYGFMNYNTGVAHTEPCMFINDERHAKTKQFFFDIYHDTYKNMSMKYILDLVHLEFTRFELEPFEDDRDTLQFEDCIRKALVNVLFFILLEEYPGDPMLVYEWQQRCVTFMISFGGGSKDACLYARSMAMLERTEKVKSWKTDTADDSGMDYLEKVRQLLHMFFFNAIGAERPLMSCFGSILRLNEDADLKAQLKADVDRLYSSDDIDAVFPTLTTLKRFYLENLRMFPPASFFFGRAIKDFKLKDKDNNTYQVKQNELLNVVPFACQRDPDIYPNPDVFDINRPIEDLEKYNVTLGGFYLEKPTVSNHKCGGDDLAHMIMNAFIIHLLKCDLEPTIIPPLYQSKLGRHGLTADPTRLVSFKYHGTSCQ